jgi:hypothetical protein
MGASSNFGNMFSVIGASLWLPYLPMSPIKILTNNLLYDFSQVPIPTDEVDPEQVAKPRPWDTMGHGGDRAVHSRHWSMQLRVRLYNIFDHVVCV